MVRRLHPPPPPPARMVRAKGYQASSRQGLREGLVCRLVRVEGLGLRVDGLCSALGLEPAFRQGLGSGVGFKVQVKVNTNRGTHYFTGLMACVM